MVKNSKKLKYPPWVVKAPAGATPEVLQRYRQHNFEVRKKEAKIAVKKIKPDVPRKRQAVRSKIKTLSTTHKA